MTLELRKFDMKKIIFDPKDNKGPVVVMVGKRDTGKSFLVKDLLYHHRDIPIGTVISGTEAGNGFYAGLVPKLFIHDEYNTMLIENVIRRQKTVLKQIKREMDTYKKCAIDPRAFVILDDCLWDNTWTRDKLMRALFLNGRHFKVILIITMQFPLGIPPNLRTNIDYTFILRETSINNRKRLWDNYASVFPTFESFCDVMNQCTNNYDCLVVDNTSKSNQLTDQIFWYKANPHEDFKLGSREFWELSKNLAEDDDDEDGKFHVKGGKKGSLTVKKV
jgi:hypothetical protein